MDRDWGGENPSLIDHSVLGMRGQSLITVHDGSNDEANSRVNTPDKPQGLNVNGKIRRGFNLVDLRVCKKLKLTAKHCRMAKS